MNRIRFGSAFASSNSFLIRSSNSPRNFVPATSAPMLISTIRLPPNTCASLPSAIRCASPSTIAVLPTPASPTSTGLLFVLRARVWMTCSISLRRPITGARSPSRAAFVKSRPKRSRIGWRSGCSVPSGAFAFFSATGPGWPRRARIWVESAARSAPFCSKAVTTMRSFCSSNAANNASACRHDIERDPAIFSAAAKTSRVASER